MKYWAKAEEHFHREYGITKCITTPANFIVHTRQEVNDGIAHGRYFVMDVAKDGIALYQSDDSVLYTPKPETPKDALKLTREYFDEWLPSGAGMLETARFSQQQGRVVHAVCNERIAELEAAAK